MYSEDDFFMLSALQHYIFCPRQCAIIHLEQHWSENRFTIEGQIMHERVDESGKRFPAGIRQEYAVMLKSARLGLIGRADVVEFHSCKKKWLPFPVEYKRGEPKSDKCDEVQLCAQAICLEEMMQCEIPEGALFYGQTKHRLTIPFTDELRALTCETAEKIHELLSSGTIPPPIYERRKCDRCSLYDYCQPLSSALSANNYLRDSIL